MFLAIQSRYSLSTCMLGRSACAGWTSLDNKLSTLSYPGAGTQGHNQIQLFNKNSRIERRFELRKLREFSSSAYFRNKEEQSFYEVLGISPQASGREVKDAYLKLSKIYHPDRNLVENQEAPTKEDNSAKFQAISEAYEILSNSDLRSKYDTGVLGRSSSVADKEKSTHRYEKEAFYESRSKRAGSEINLEKWVSDYKSKTFRAAQSHKSGRNCGMKKHKDLFIEAKENEKFHNSMFKFIGYPLLFIFIIIKLIQNA